MRLPGIVWLFVLVSLPAFPLGANDATLVSTSLGSLRGVREGDSIHFRGVPYARPPTGPLRWQPPQPPTPWQGVLDAQHFGDACPQKAFRGGRSEDCLTLNVVTPANRPEKPAPVLVSIHGGGFVSGSGSSLASSARYWNEAGIILVTFNYRLGAMGFFAHPDLDAGSGANFALLDMLAALGWVRDNIAAFGGDPRRVTVMGVSAGGMAVNMLMVTPPAEGLFHRAIAQSGYGTWPKPRTRHAPVVKDAPSAEQMSHDHAARAAGRTGRAPELAELHAIDAQAFAEAFDGFQLPLVDGVSLPEETGRLFAAGRQHAVPYLSGGNSLDGSVFRWAAIPESAVLAMLGESEKMARELYARDFAISETMGVVRLFGDMRYVHSAYHMTRQMHRAGAPGYLYRFDYVPPEKLMEWPGAPHASEMPQLFAGDTPVARRMRHYWINFIREGDPNTEGLPAWPPADSDDPAWMVFDEPPRVVKGLVADRMRLLEDVYRRRNARTSPGQAARATVPTGLGPGAWAPRLARLTRAPGSACTSP